ncbi:MAG TPA: hypothetical protein VIN57_04100 [Magnetovibrio sp.]
MSPPPNPAEIQNVLDYATHSFGHNSDIAVLLRKRLAEVERENVAVNRNDKPQRSTGDQLTDGLAKSPVLLVGLGVAVAAAMMGLSTLFIGMLAAKWLTF